MFLVWCRYLRTPRRRFAGAERGSRVLQDGLNALCERVCTAEHASGRPLYALHRRHGLAEIVKRGGSVTNERPRVIKPQLERIIITVAVDASRHKYRFAQQWFDFFEAP